MENGNTAPHINLDTRWWLGGFMLWTSKKKGVRVWTGFI